MRLPVGFTGVLPSPIVSLPGRPGAGELALTTGNLTRYALAEMLGTGALQAGAHSSHAHGPGASHRCSKQQCPHGAAGQGFLVRTRVLVRATAPMTVDRIAGPPRTIGRVTSVSPVSCPGVRPPSRPVTARPSAAPDKRRRGGTRAASAVTWIGLSRGGGPWGSLRGSGRDGESGVAPGDGGPSSSVQRSNSVSPTNPPSAHPGGWRRQPNPHG